MHKLSHSHRLLRPLTPLNRTTGESDAGASMSCARQCQVREAVGRWLVGERVKIYLRDLEVKNGCIL